LERILSQWPIVEAIREKCGVGSISVGVLHHGEVLFTGSTGYRDVDKEEEADTHTLYTLCSICKSFVAAAVGILVDRGECDWTDPVGPYLPEFKAKGDPRVSTEATIYDFLRHSGGLANPVVTLLGPEGKVLVPEGDFINVLNDTPTGNESFGPYFNASWEYSNVAYGLIALVIERVSGKRFADFVSEEILEPLGMNDTAVYKSQVASNNNLARSFVRLSDGTWYKQPEHEWTDDLNNPILAMVGIRSSVNDLLIWCAATMDAYWGDASRPLAALSGVTNPLREIHSILDDDYMYWTRPHNDDLQNPCNYHLSWLECVMPSSMTHWGSWNKTLSDYGYAPQEQINSQILGRDSPQQTLYKCSGAGFCGLGSINLFPDTMSAIVVMSSGLNAGDPSDFTTALFTAKLMPVWLIGSISWRTGGRTAIFHSRNILRITISASTKDLGSSSKYGIGRAVAWKSSLTGERRSSRPWNITIRTCIATSPPLGTIGSEVPGWTGITTWWASCTFTEMRQTSQPLVLPGHGKEGVTPPFSRRGRLSTPLLAGLFSALYYSAVPGTLAVDRVFYSWPAWYFSAYLILFAGSRPIQPQPSGIYV